VLVALDVADLEECPTPLVIGESHTIPGSVGAAIAEYLSSSAFVTNRRNGKRKSETTTGKERWILDSFRVPQVVFGVGYVRNV